MLIRQARPEDASQIAKLHIKSWQHAYKGIIAQSYLDRLDHKKRTKSWRDTIIQNKCGLLIAFNGEALIGFAHIGKSRENPHPDHAEL